uniref:Band 7 domain-containing protein n=1 Tax=Meloidogyne javanica TaxID=6303 RepID=A0A915LJT2_MELJA
MDNNNGRMTGIIVEGENNVVGDNRQNYSPPSARKPRITEEAAEAEPYGQIVNQYERAVIFRLGQLRKGGARGPGLFFVIPCIDEYRKVDLRVVSFQVPPQELLSKDSVTANVDAVVYFRVSNATVSIVNVEDAKASTKLLAMTTLRNVLGTKTLSEMLSDRDHISHQMQEVLDEATEHWGVKVERVEVKDVRLPREMQRAMAAEAEAQREARAKIIAAEGEQKASRALRDAALTISDTPTALQLRYLQTLGTISAEHNSTIVFPFPVDLMSMFVQNHFGNNSNQQSHSSQTAQHVNNFCGDLGLEKKSEHPAFVPD